MFQALGFFTCGHLINCSPVQQAIFAFGMVEFEPVTAGEHSENAYSQMKSATST